MRIILYTGKGGVGKTSIAAAAAIRSADRGLKTLVVSADAAHSLGDCLDRQLAPEPEEIQPNLWAQEIDITHEVEKGWGLVQEYFTKLFTSKAVKDITTEELTVFPGMEDLMSLIRILKYYRENTFDVIIIDCAPTGETLALLSFPDMFRWWMDKLFPIKRKAAKIAKPIVEPLVGVPVPGDDVMAEFEKVYRQLDEMRQIFTDGETTSIRIVVNPEKMVVKEAQRSFTYLNLYDYKVDSIIVNRVIPEEVTDPHFKIWKDIQGRYGDMIRESFNPVPIFHAPLFEKEVVGTEMLKRLGDAIYGKEDPTSVFYRQRTQQYQKEGGHYLLSIYMPFVDKKELSLSQKGEELIIRAGLTKRTIVLPRTLRSHSVKGAKFEKDRLNIVLRGEKYGEESDGQNNRS